MNPFLDDDDDDDGHETDDDDAARARRDGSSWYIVDEEVVDPWRGERIGPFYGVRCRGRLCRADPERAIFLTRPRATRTRRVPRRLLELAALAAASTVGHDGRARLEVQATVRRRAFGLGLSVSTSGGDVRVGDLDVSHARHTFTLVLEHRLSDGTISLDLGVATGLMLSELEGAQLTPVARVLATAGIPLARNVELLVRADALTTFVRPGEVASGGPSAFEFGMGVGLRISTP